MSESRLGTRPMDARLALPAVTAWAVLVVVLGVEEALLPVAVASWIGAGVSGVLALSLRARPAAFVCVVLAATGVLATSAALQAPARSPAALTEAADSRRHVSLLVTLDETVHGEGAANVRASINHASFGDTSLTGQSISVLLLGLDGDEAGIGTTLELGGTLIVTDPGDDLAYLVSVDTPVTLVAPPPWTLAWAHALRIAFRDAAVALPGDGGRLLPGLSIGDTSAVPDTLDEAMKRTALSHLTAVSGANCAVVVGLIMGLGAACGWSRRARIGWSLTALLFFVVLVTPEPSVLRAAVMASVVLVALARGRPARGVPVLALAVVTLLTIDPWLARQYGFIMSVLATAGLLVLAGPIARHASRIMPTPVAIALAVPLAAQLACQPVLLLLTPTIPMYGVVANILAGLAATAATVLGLIACVLVTLVPPLGQIAAAIAWVPSAWVAAVARFCEALPGAQAPWVPGLAGVVGASAVLVLTSWAAIRDRRGPLFVAIAGVLVWSGAVMGSSLHRALITPTDWQVAACSIGQGDAMLVRSEGRVALIDTGEHPELLEDCLDRLGIAHIHLLVLTHFDLDHVGGAPAVFGRATHALVGPASDASDIELRAALETSGTRVTEVTRGDTGTLGDLSWRVLWPPAQGHVEPGNPASVVVQFTPAGECGHGCVSSLFLGDLGEAEQNRMLALSRPGTVDVVKVAHHGSRDQSPRLYAALGARVGLIGVGENTYGHPTHSALEALRDARTATARTDTHGLILVSPTRGGVRVWTEHGTVTGGGRQ